MSNRDRFKCIMRFEPADRLPMVEWANWWDKTLVRWYEEGLDTNLKDHAAIREHLGLDNFQQMWISPRFGLPKYNRASGCITDDESYNCVHSHYDPDNAVDLETLERWNPCQARGEMVFWLTLDGFYWIGRELFGIAAHNYSFFDKPELVHRINQDLLEFNFSVLDKICSICTPDFMTIAEDMSYNHGPMISRPMFDDFILPYYQQIVPAIKKRGILPFVDSDGDVTELMQWLVDAGIEGILPLERQAGTNIVEFRKRYPRTRIIGGFDKTVMAQGIEAMRREFERLMPVMKQGGYIPSIDHQTPPEVSMSMYEQYVELLHEYCLEAMKSSN